MSLLEKTLARIEPLDAEAARAATARLDSLTKPHGSLGYLEEIVRRYAAIRHDATAAPGRGVIAVFAADHGVADARVSAYPLPGVRYRRVGAGTENFLHGPAMSAAQAHQAIGVGIETAREITATGATLIGIGEMGIANSTAAAAILAALTWIDPARLAGRGTGVDDAGLRRKIKVIEAGLSLHRAATSDGVTALAALGGFEIAAMAGVCLGGAAARVPVVVDGFIATAAAAAAEKIRPGLCDYLFFSHRSAERGHALALEALRARPILDLDLRLGEGTGAAIAMDVIGAALALFREMATFAGAGVSGKN